MKEGTLREVGGARREGIGEGKCISVLAIGVEERREGRGRVDGKCVEGREMEE